MDIGHVVYYKNDAIYPIKYKYGLCIYIAEKFGLLMINSENREIYNCTEPIKQIRYSFLKYDSYISCSRVFKLEIDAEYKVKGLLDYEDINMVYAKVKKSITISKKDKELIFSQKLTLSTT